MRVFLYPKTALKIFLKGITFYVTFVYNRSLEDGVIKQLL